MEVGDTEGVEAEVVDMAGVGMSGGLGEGPGVEAREVDTEGNEELAGVLTVAFLAGPITCSKSIQSGVSKHRHAQGACRLGLSAVARAAR
jgi:hypothetical protein